MQKLNLAIIGAGNIVRTRHLPVLQHQKLFKIVGILDIHGLGAAELAKKYNIPHHESYKKYKSLHDISWFAQVDAVLIATPPFEHAPMVKQALEAGKHVLVEKPFVTNLDDGRALISLAKKKKLILAVCHNFQFSRAFSQLTRLIEKKELGKITSFYCPQLSNDARRLPRWAEKLNGGLFYDESPHVFYLLRKYGGKSMQLDHVFSVPPQKNKTTPRVINIQLSSSTVPITIYINFMSPICEWYFIVFGTKKAAVVDLFRDIITVFPHDGQHLTKEVLTTSFIATTTHWHGVLRNGVDYLQQKLFWGMDEVYERFYNAVSKRDKKYIVDITGADGLAVNELQHLVVTSFQ